ncbi:DUF4837 family protein [bacterium]|nr:DUF4837 family protein [bacterium]
MKKTCLSIIILSVILLTSNCSKRLPDAFGPYLQVIVFSDPGEKEIVKNPLSYVIEREIKTPQFENMFYTAWVDSFVDNSYLDHRNLVFIASLKSEGNVGKWIRQNLSPEARELVEKYSAYIFVKKDVWAQGQSVIIFTATEPELLSAQIIINADDIFEILDESVNQRIEEWIFSEAFGEGEQNEIEQKIIDDYGFSIRVPRNFDFEKGSPESHFIWLRHLKPEQWVFVWWEDTSDITLSLDWWISKRDSLCKVHYEGDSVVQNSLSYQNAIFDSLPALEIRGLWQNKTTLVGGPLVSYVFFDPEKNRKYIVDAAVFAAGVKKAPYLRHTRIIANTFRANPENGSKVQASESQ